MIVPLMKQPTMKGFSDAIMTTTIDLCDGVLHNVREVEVNLALNGSVSDSGIAWPRRTLIASSDASNPVRRMRSS